MSLYSQCENKTHAQSKKSLKDSVARQLNLEKNKHS